MRHCCAEFNFVFVYSFFPPLSSIELEDSDQTTLLYCQAQPEVISIIASPPSGYQSFLCFVPYDCC